MRNFSAAAVTALCLLLQLLLLSCPGESIRCSICTTSAGEHGNSCLTRPPPATECKEGMDFCINVAKYTEAGDLRSFTRSCSPLMWASSAGCVPGTDQTTNELVQLCYYMCDTNDCNGSESIHHLLNLLRRRRRK